VDIVNVLHVGRKVVSIKKFVAMQAVFISPITHECLTQRMSLQMPFQFKDNQLEGRGLTEEED